MSIKSFLLPDLGEGLPDAEVVSWFVNVGDVIKLDEPLVSMETAKAVVDVPSPFSGRVVKLYGKAGDVIDTATPLCDIEVDASMPQRADAQDTGHHHAPKAPAKATAAPEPAKETREDAGTVVGAMSASNEVKQEAVVSVGGIKAVPAVRAMAKKMNVDLTRVRGTGPDGAISMVDVKHAAANPSSMAAVAPSPATVAASAAAPTVSAVVSPNAGFDRAPVSSAGKPVRTTPPGVVARGQPEPLRGVRRNMARIMAEAHAQVVPTTLCDDADVHAWQAGQDITVRLVRAIVLAAKAEPALNAWFDMANQTRTLHNRVDIGIAVDTDEGLFVPALRNADMLDARAVRESVNRLRAQVADRSLAASELTGYTISLSNFGMFAGKYATPVIVPPCVAIVAAGRGRHQVVPVLGGIETHKIIPISVTFDHRAATGGEAARFLKVLLDDLARAV